MSNQPTSASNLDDLLRQSEAPLKDHFTALRQDAAHLEGKMMRGLLIDSATASSMSPSTTGLFTVGGKAISISTTLMITAGLAAITFLIVNLLTPSTVIHQTAQQKINTPKIESPSASSVSIQQFQSLRHDPTHRKTISPIPVVDTDSEAYRPVNLEGIIPIPIEEEFLPKLGIRTDTSGDLTFYNRATYSCQVESHTLLSNEEVNSGFSISDTNDVRVMSSAPRMITDRSGKLRFLRFEVRSFSKSNVRALFQINDSSNTEDGMAEVTFGQGGPFLMVQQEGDSLRALRHHSNQPSVEIGNGKVGVDVTNGRATATSHADGTVSVVPQPNKVQSTNSKISIASEQFGVITNSVVNRGTSPLAVQLNDDARKSKWDSNFSSVLKDVRDEQRDANHLIPVLIRNTKGGKTNEVIMWYDPSPELTAILPEITQSSSVAPKNPPGALKELTISPNPAGNSTTIHYTLSEERNVRFTLYTLVGERVLQITRSKHCAGGTGTEPVNLSSIRTGLYLLVATTDKGEQLTQRLVVEK